GNVFWSKYENDNLGTLYTFLRDNMPQDGPSLVDDAIKADILAYIMSMNGMPAGNDELKADVRALESIKGAKKTTWEGGVTIAHCLLFQVVGCLTPGAGRAWTLTRTSEPAITRDEEPTAAALKTAQTKALGAQTYTLVSVGQFKPDDRKGQKVEARGLIYRD